MTFPGQPAYELVPAEPMPAQLRALVDPSASGAVADRYGARAIIWYRRRMATTYPPSVDVARLLAMYRRAEYAESEDPEP